MRVYNRSKFMKLPVGGIFCKGEPWAFDRLHVKGATWPETNDFLACSLQWIESDSSTQSTDRLDEMLETGASYPMNADYGRDGCFDDNDVFLVWEPADLEKMIELFHAAISAATAIPADGASRR